MHPTLQQQVVDMHMQRLQQEAEMERHLAQLDLEEQHAKRYLLYYLAHLVMLTYWYFRRSWDRKFEYGVIYASGRKAFVPAFALEEQRREEVKDVSEVSLPVAGYLDLSLPEMRELVRHRIVTSRQRMTLAIVSLGVLIPLTLLPLIAGPMSWAIVVVLCLAVIALNIVFAEL